MVQIALDMGATHYHPHRRISKMESIQALPTRLDIVVLAKVTVVAMVLLDHRVIK